MKKLLILIMLMTSSLVLFSQSVELSFGGGTNYTTSSLNHPNLEDQEFTMSPGFALQVAAPVHGKIFIKTEFAHQALSNVYHEYHYNYAYNKPYYTSKYPGDFFSISLLPEYRFNQYFGINAGPVFLNEIGGEPTAYYYSLMNLGLKSSFLLRHSINNTGLGLFLETGYMRVFGVYFSEFDFKKDGPTHNVFFQKIGLTYFL